jgi:two-component system, cell cycle sensor histidine kinase and response regulator CckA
MQHNRSNPSRTANHQSGVELLDAAALACPHGLMIEERGTVKYANAAYARLAGYSSPEHVIGVRVPTLKMPTEPLPKINGAVARTYDNLRFEFPHGSRTVRLHVVRDVTERRALESRLLESEKMEALGRLVGGVAHDFNNILTAITLHSDLLRERQVEGTREIDEIREAAQRGAELVRQLLTFARQHPAEPKVVSIRQMIASMSAIVEPLIGEDIELVQQFSVEQDCVRADPTQLQQVILNLVMNARDALPKGGRISIQTGESELHGRDSVRHGLNPGHYVCLTVEENGCGMNEVVRARIFEPFYTTKKHGAGTGLGMSMVYGIVRQAGGSVAVASKVGKGTRVTVLLPRLARVQKDERVEKEFAVDGHETVLLAEDDAAVRTSITRLLSARGYSVLQANDGMQAVRTARTYKQPIHLLLSDVVMPRMNGKDAAVEILKSHPETKVLFISGYPAKAATAASSATLLFKPFSRNTLERKVRETLEERSPSRKAAHGHFAVRGMP